MVRRKKWSQSTEARRKRSPNFLFCLSVLLKHSLRCRRQCVRALRITVFEGRWWSRRGFAFPAVTPSPKGTPMILWICMNKRPLKSHFGTNPPLRRSTPQRNLVDFYAQLLHIFNFSSRCQQIIPLMQFECAQEIQFAFHNSVSSNIFCPLVRKLTVAWPLDTLRPSATVASGGWRCQLYFSPPPSDSAAHWKPCSTWSRSKSSLTSYPVYFNAILIMLLIWKPLEESFTWAGFKIQN